MNLSRKISVVAMLSMAVSAQSAQQKPAAPPPPAPEPVQIQAVFINPKARPEGVDPFFPKSERPYIEFRPPATPTKQPISMTADLKLSGISGSLDHRLAIINNKTFEIGEEGDVASGSDRVRIRLLEIKSDSVIVQFVAGGLRREIHLRRGL